MSANYADLELRREKKEKYIDPDYFSVCVCVCVFYSMYIMLSFLSIDDL